MPDTPGWTALSLGICHEVGHEVTSGDCKVCFWTRTGRPDHRDMCIAQNISRPDDITGYDLSRLSEGAVRGILGNIALVANHNRHEATSQTALREIRLHLSQEAPNETP